MAFRWRIRFRGVGITRFAMAVPLTMSEPLMMWPNHEVQMLLGAGSPNVGIKFKLPVAFASLITVVSNPERPRPA